MDAYNAFSERNYNMALKLFSQQLRNSTHRNHHSLVNNMCLAQYELDKDLNSFISSLNDLLKDKKYATESLFSLLI